MGLPNQLGHRSDQYPNGQLNEDRGPVDAYPSKEQLSYTCVECLCGTVGIKRGKLPEIELS